ncbi:MAG: 16S rRNA (uracil(1498)-N(3))-methyltransferase [Phycisphaerae bacterium]|nr:16S rRNA (uracil(1498)-N(3))-methyltransferase [Phycisphaerae bacterium]
MKLNRFYCDSIEIGSLELDSVESHHLMHVMRLGVGSNVELFDGNGVVAKGIVANASRKGVRVDVHSREVFEAPTTGRVIIAASVAKGQRFDLVIAKCTELGVDCIVPLIFERTVKQPAGGSVADRYKKLSIVAAKQCGRIFLPEIVSPCGLDSGLEYLKARFQLARGIYGGFGADSVSVGSVFDVKFDILAFIGPEGGIMPEEEKKLEEFGAVKVGLTKTILRTETASIAFGSILCVLRDGYGA